MVGTDLFVGRRVDGGAQTKLDAITLLQAVELPPDELVIVLVYRGGNEGAAVVNGAAKALQIIGAQR